MPITEFCLLYKVCLSFCPSVFLELYQFFSKFWHVARNPYVVVLDRARFLGNKLGKWTKNGPKSFGHYFLLNLLYNSNIYCLLCFCANLIFQKSFFPRYGPKCYQPIRLQDFFNQAYLQRKFKSYSKNLKLTVSQEWIDWKFFSRFLHAGAHLGKLKLFQWFLGGHGEK